VLLFSRDLPVRANRIHNKIQLKRAKFCSILNIWLILLTVIVWQSSGVKFSTHFSSESKLVECGM